MIPEPSSGFGALGFRVGGFQVFLWPALRLHRYTLVIGGRTLGLEDGTGLAGIYLPSEGKWPVGLGHDHFAVRQ
jgi:hypothetical protein